MMRFVSWPGNSRRKISSPCRASALGGNIPMSLAPSRIRLKGEPSSRSTAVTGSKIFHGWAMTTAVRPLQKFSAVRPQRPAQGVGDGALANFVPEAAHDEERVVDGDRQADHSHDVAGIDGDGADA